MSNPFAVFEADEEDDISTKSNKHKNNHNKQQTVGKKKNTKKTNVPQPEATKIPEGFTVVAKKIKPRKVKVQQDVSVESSDLGKGADNLYFVSNHPLYDFQMLVSLFAKCGIKAELFVYVILSKVCRKWNQVANSHVVWKSIVMQNEYGSKEQRAYILTQPIINQGALWKKMYIECSHETRRKQHLRKTGYGNNGYFWDDTICFSEPKDIRRKIKNRNLF